MEMYASPQPLSLYLNRPLDCPCGRTHYVPIKGVEIGPAALKSLPRYAKELGYRHPYILCDPITYRVAGAQCQAMLEEAGLSPTLHILTHLGFDEATLGEILLNKPEDCDLMIGCGTGSITDILRYSSFKLKLPCFTVATGAPMDGFAASIGILNVNSLKATLPAHNSELIIGDTQILQTAPYRMTIAGFGDLLGKLSCLNDWRLSRLVNGEHYCPQIAELVEDCVRQVMAQSAAIKRRDPAVLGALMSGLVLSGAAISLYGDSRPASGAEHHMSHFWETVKEQRGEPAAMHGEQVAVGTVLILMLAEELQGLTPDFGRAREAARRYDPACWEEEIHRVYGEAAPEVLRLEEAADKNGTAGRLARIDSMEQCWPAIQARLRSYFPSAELRRILEDVGCPSSPAEIGVDRALLKDTFLYCKEIRPRYTILQLAYDLELLDELADRVIDRLPEI